MSNSIQLGNVNTLGIQLTPTRALVLTAEKTGVRHAIKDGGYTVGSFVLSTSQLQAVQFAQNQAVSALGRKTLRAESVKLDSLRTLLIEPRGSDCLYSIRLGGVVVGSFVATPAHVAALKSAQDIAYQQHLRMAGRVQEPESVAYRERVIGMQRDSGLSLL